jgi:energy-coupling factor transport system substrate-specific component
MTRNISQRTLLAALAGAALYAIFNLVAFEIRLPGAQDVSIRPHYGLLTFFGFAFGPVVGFVVGYVGNSVGDWMTTGAPFGSWHWSVANGLVGAIAGLMGTWTAWRLMPRQRQAVTAAVVSVIATVIGFGFIWIELVIQPELGANFILTREYLPVVLGNGIAALVVTPILAIAWAPLEPHLMP